MGVYIRWSQPNSETAYTTAVIERATSSSGTYSALASQSISDTTYYDATGSVSSWYRLRFYDGTNYSEYTPSMQGIDTLGYLTIEEVRVILKLQTAEYSDSDVQLIINKATKRVDDILGRTWQGIFEVKNEFYDGDDSNILYLNKTDIRNVTALAIDESGDGTWTDIGVSSLEIYEEGKVFLNTEKTEAEVEYFTKGNNNVRVSYTHGNQQPTESIKDLCLLFIAQFVKSSQVRTELIDKTVKSLRFNRPNLV